MNKKLLILNNKIIKCNKCKRLVNFRKKIAKNKKKKYFNQKYWGKPITGFGDWSSIIDDIEPFRDEKASERLTKFLYWLIEGFKEGLSKKENLEI